MAELPDTITPLSPEQVANAFIEAARVLGVSMNTDMLGTLLAHSALETGNWKALKSYAFGHVKHHEGMPGDHMFIGELVKGRAGVSENLTEAQVIVAKRQSKRRKDGGEGLDMKVGKKRKDGKWTCWFWPSHPQARFRAFVTAAEGAQDYLTKLNGRYNSALDHARAGDPKNYVNEIQRLGYFTAGLVPYRKKVGQLFAKYLPVARKAMAEYAAPMSDPYDLDIPDDFIERDEVLLDAVRSGDFEHEWMKISLGPRTGISLTVQISRDAMKFDCVRYGTTPFTQQLIADELKAMVFTPKLADIHAAWARNDGGLVGPFPQPISSKTSAYQEHTRKIDEALPEHYAGVVSSFKHWCISKDVWAKRGFTTNYGWHASTGAQVGLALIPSVSDAELTVVQGPYEAHHEGQDVDNDGYADSGHGDYSQLLTFVSRTAWLNGMEVDLADVYMGKHGAEATALISHEGALPGWRLPGVPYADHEPDGGDESEQLGLLIPGTMPRITHPGEQGDDVFAWQQWLLKEGYKLSKYGADRDHGGETEAATQKAMVAYGLRRGPDEEAPDTEPSPVSLAYPSLNMDVVIIKARYFRPGRPHGDPNTIIMHTAEVRKHDLSAEGLGSYAKNMADGRMVSWHDAIDCDSIVQCVATTDIAFAAGPLNDRGINIELATRAKLTWADKYAKEMLELAAARVAEHCLKHGIPIKKLDANQLYAGLPGIAGHSDVSGACIIARRKGVKARPWWSPSKNRWRKTDHGDPGRGFPWLSFLARVRAYAS